MLFNRIVIFTDEFSLVERANAIPTMARLATQNQKVAFILREPVYVAERMAEESVVNFDTRDRQFGHGLTEQPAHHRKVHRFERHAPGRSQYAELPAPGAASF